MILISLFCCCEKVFIHTNIWMVYFGKFSETSLPKKEDFYSYKNMKHITNADYKHAKSVFKDFKMKYFGEYHDFYVQSDALLLLMYLITFRICLEVYV